MPTVVCLDLPPFVASLVRRLRPDADVFTDLSTLDDVVRCRPSAVIAEGSHPLVAALSRTRLATRVIALAANASDLPPASHRGAFLARPVDPDELAAALVPRLGDGIRDRIERAGRALREASSLEVVLAGLRAGAGLAGGLLQPSRGLSVTEVGGASLAAAIVITRLRVRSLSMPMVGVNAALVALVVVLTGGARSPFLFLAAVTAVEFSLIFPAWLVATVIGLSTALGAADLALGLSAAEPGLVLAWSLVLPMCGVIGSLLANSRGHPATVTHARMLELNETLLTLQRQSAVLGGSLELSTVAGTIVDEAVETCHAAAALVLLGEPPVVEVAGRRGLHQRIGGRLAIGDHGDALSPESLEWLQPGWAVIVEPLNGPDHIRLGWLAVFDRQARTREGRRAVRNLASDAGLALANVRVFDRIRDFSVDAERRRLARELHDGAVQSLVHVGFELDLVARELPEQERGLVRSARQVVGETVEEVRRTLAGLTSARLVDGLGPALESVAAEFAVPGHPAPRIATRISPLPRLAPEAELQLLRIAQEAMSNAVQHAEATTIVLTVDVIDGVLQLAVEDDGAGLTGSDQSLGPAGADLLEEANRGVGLRAMAERARLLGANLQIAGVDGGTNVRISVALSEVGQ